MFLSVLKVNDSFAKESYTSHLHVTTSSDGLERDRRRRRQPRARALEAFGRHVLIALLLRRRASRWPAEVVADRDRGPGGRGRADRTSRTCRSCRGAAAPAPGGRAGPRRSVIDLTGLDRSQNRRSPPLPVHLRGGRDLQPARARAETRRADDAHYPARRSGHGRRLRRGPRSGRASTRYASRDLLLSMEFVLASGE